MTLDVYSHLHLDVETRSVADLKKVGNYAYFQHPSTELLCAAWAFDNEEPVNWLPGQLCPQRIVDHVNAGGMIFAWNAAFERQCWNNLLTKVHGWPEAYLRQFMCTMAEAMAMSLPGALKDAAPAIGLPMDKDGAGHKLMLQMCKPRNHRKDEMHLEGPLWYEDEDRRQRLAEYCLQDVRVEQGISQRVLRLRPEEKEIFWLDAEINDRGVFIDEAMCLSAKTVVHYDMKRLDGQMANLTDGAVEKCSQVTALMRYLKDFGVPAESLAKEKLNELLIMDGMPETCMKALELRAEAAKTSTAKINAMLLRRNEDGRMRGNLQYHGAGTGRWAARGAQLQNLPRPVIITGKTNEEAEEMQRVAMEAISYGSCDLLNTLYGKPLTVVADCIRGLIKAEPGNDLISADFSNIEGRVNAWLAGQDDKLVAFKASDDKTGPDLYLVAAAAVYGVPISEAKKHRQVGKVCELALGYQGGPGAFANMAKNYGLKIGELYDGIWERATVEDRETVMGAWKSRGTRSGMAEKSWVAAELIKVGWRRKNHRIAEYWYEAQNAAYEAFENPGITSQARFVQYRMAGSFLWCQLPSGRTICYPYPHKVNMCKAKVDGVNSETVSWGEAKRKGYEITGEAKQQLAYKAVDQYTRRWGRKFFYGGLAVENITQAVARDVMAEAMVRVQNSGYPITLTVHDEIVSEVPADFGSLEEFNALMNIKPSWGAGIPVAVAGWRGERYRK